LLIPLGVVLVALMLRCPFAKWANGWRYPLGVGVWTRPRNGIPLKPEKAQKNAGRTPSRVHALLGG
jgi:hypothetical protein